MKPMGYEGPRGETGSRPAQLDATFSALADPTRRAILTRLASGPATVTELAQPFAMSQPAVSKHLKVLERAGLVSRSRDAQRRPCRLEAWPLQLATGWLEDYRGLWEERYQHLDTLLDELQSTDQRDEVRAPAAGREARSQAERRPDRRSSGES